MANIEETIFDDGLPVNSIAMANRLIEILRANKTNSFSSLPEPEKIKYKMCLWLINQQVYGQCTIVDMYDEWNDLRVKWKKHSQISVCICGHTGGGPNTQHRGRYASGHGACKAKDCNCKQFTWDKFFSENKKNLPSSQ